MAKLSRNYISSDRLRATYNKFVFFLDRAEKTSFLYFSETQFFDFQLDMLNQFEAWLQKKIEKMDSFLIDSEEKIAFLKFSSSLNRAFVVGFRSLARRSDENEPTMGFQRKTKKGGQFNISLIKYIRLLIITAQADFIRAIFKIRSIEKGLDLVRIDPQFSTLGRKPSLICNIWKDRIVAIVGVDATFPTIDEITRQGMFHPHCTHNITPLTEKETELALKTRIKTYSKLRRL